MADFTTQQFEFDFPASGSPGYVEYTGFTTQGFDPCSRGNLSNASARAVAEEVWAKFLTAEIFQAGQAGDLLLNKLLTVPRFLAFRNPDERKRI